MATGQAVFSGTAGSTVDVTAGGKVTALSGSAVYENGAPLGSWLTFANPGSANAVVRQELTPDRYVVHGYWTRLSALPSADQRLLETNITSADNLAAYAFIVAASGSVRLIAPKNTAAPTQATATGLVFPTGAPAGNTYPDGATPVWVSLYTDAGNSATTGRLRLAYFTQAGGNTPIYDGGLITGVNVADAVGTQARIRAGKYGPGSYAGTLSIAALTWRTGADATDLLLPALPATNSLPTASYSASVQTAAAGGTVEATLNGFDSDGTIAGYQHAVDFPGAGGPTLAAPTAAKTSFTAPAAPALVKLVGYVTDNAGGQSVPVTCEIRVPGTAAQFTALSTVATTTGTVTQTGGGTPGGAVLADTSDASYLELASGASVLIRATPIVTQAGFSAVFRLGTDTGTAAARAQLMSNGAVVSSAADITATTTATDYTIPITNLAGVTDWGNLYARLTAL